MEVKKQMKILVNKALYKTLSSLAEIILIKELFSDSLGTRNKERDFWAKPSSLGKTPIGVLDPKIPHFLDSAYWAISKLLTSS